MGERDLANKVLTDEEKAKITNDSIKLQKELVSKEHGVSSLEELMDLSPDELAHRFVEIADRGFVSMRLAVPMPSDWHGEWIPNDSQSIAEAKMKGFIIDDRFAVKYGLHSDGTDNPIIGDVIHMICPMKIKNAHDAAAKIRFQRIHGKPRDLPEEAAFESSIEKLGLGTRFKGNDINTSIQLPATQSELLNAARGT